MRSLYDIEVEVDQDWDERGRKHTTISLYSPISEDDECSEIELITSRRWAASVTARTAIAAVHRMCSDIKNRRELDDPYFEVSVSSYDLVDPAGSVGDLMTVSIHVRTAGGEREYITPADLGRWLTVIRETLAELLAADAKPAAEIAAEWARLEAQEATPASPHTAATPARPARQTEETR